jgi:single-stranded DNA-binding protein
LLTRFIDPLQDEISNLHVVLVLHDHVAVAADFGKQAEFTRTLTRGSYVMVQGAVRTREYDRDGVKHGIVEVRADTIGKLDRTERRTEVEGEPDTGDA